MQNLQLLMTALEYTEAHLSSEINTQDIADACFHPRKVISQSAWHFRT